jgi:hypothetical protein
MAQGYRPQDYALKIGYRHFGSRLFVVLQHFLANLAPEALATPSLPYEFGNVAVLY